MKGTHLTLKSMGELVRNNPKFQTLTQTALHISKEEADWQAFDGTRAESGISGRGPQSIKKFRSLSFPAL